MKKYAVVTLVLVFVVVLSSLCFLYRDLFLVPYHNQKAFSFHNQQIRDIVSSEVEVEINSLARLNESKAGILISDSEEALWFIKQFVISPRIKGSYPYYHSCEGHIIVTISGAKSDSEPLLSQRLSG